MSLFLPGSAPWLLGHEMRLTWRFITTRRNNSKGRGWILMLILLAGLVTLSLTVGVPLARWMVTHHFQPGPFEILALDLILLLIWTLMLSQTLSNAAMVFYQRGDLDLLLSSPIPARRILAVRTMAIAGNVMPFITVVLSAFIIPIGVIAHPAWLSVYVVLGGLSLLASVAGVWMAMGLFALIGPRRTRTVAQVMAALIGAVMFLIGQTYNMMGRSRYEGVYHDVRAFAESGHFDPNSVWSWPARSVLGEPLPLILFAMVALAAYVGSTAILGERFARNAASVHGWQDGKPVKAGRDTTRFSGTPFWVLVRKELRLLARDPALMSQILLQMLYLTPIAFLMLRSAQSHALLAVSAGAAGVTFLSGQLAGSLGWVTISAEESPELLTCAPVTPERIRRAKVAAVLIPTFALVGLPLLGLIALQPLPGLVAVAGCAVTAISTSLIELWRQRPGKRSEFRRNRGSSVVVPLLEVLVGMLYGGAVAMVVVAVGMPQLWFMALVALVPVAIAAGIVALCKPAGAKLQAV